MTRSLAVGGLLAAALFVGTAAPASAQFGGYSPYGYGGGYSRTSFSYSTGYGFPGYGGGYGYGAPIAYTPFTPVWGVPRVYPSYGYGYGGGYGGYRGGYGGGFGYPGYGGYGRSGFSFGFSTFR